MIRITIELIPHGMESMKRHLGTATIVNDGTGTKEVGNYKITLSKWGKPSVAWKRGRLEGFDRLKYGAWDLLLLSLFSCLSSRVERMRKSMNSEKKEGAGEGA